MATKVKVTQKELKKPDKFLEFIDRSTNYLADNYKHIVYFVCGIIGLILIFFVINSYLAIKTSDANLLYNEAITARVAEDYDLALQKFALLQKDYSGQKVSELSLYYTASVYYNQNNYDQALSFATKFLNTNPKDSNMVDAAISLIAMSYLNKNEYNTAIDFASRITNPDSPYMGNAQMTKGLALEKLGRYEEAADIYNEILANMYPRLFGPQ
ncbi:MAG: tetratricopeptide repeat protein [Candidatus Dadabacteria bacterium]|nr:tetratricopeptide repeat protein [Candidatus Dadabacteria bacterium]NIS09742.1 tetratricopeptide repeat protein [Candidatus Dadabacteria bacterium]NIV41107.1 tetratricopeptide repeat protein [Candidatus Dadabacteria bacterium]NIX16200.1 tetratricopeptide repeat protein [Candidatus Dadabacteria bacterium]NIY22823.1 tetratricopeptide repeat protein [Candidatus Dadabacteria bacterium]